jgi:hypothetical protein
MLATHGHIVFPQEAQTGAGTMGVSCLAWITLDTLAHHAALVTPGMTFTRLIGCEA